MWDSGASHDLHGSAKPPTSMGKKLNFPYSIPSDLAITNTDERERDLTFLTYLLFLSIPFRV